ncbi:MAG TPA: hypothetical protein VNX28_15320 [Gemmataceae bacterium]|jgi:hypothetical protein|nr:hypothetical protein [Gemmataceae bacterium]
MTSFPQGVGYKGGQAAAKSHPEHARRFYAPIIPIILWLRGQGMSLRAIGLELERRKIKTRQEHSRWSASQVMRALQYVTKGMAAAPETKATVEQMKILTKHLKSAAPAPPATIESEIEEAREFLAFLQEMNGSVPRTAGQAEVPAPS